MFVFFIIVDCCLIIGDSILKYVWDRGTDKSVHRGKTVSEITDRGIFYSKVRVEKADYILICASSNGLSQIIQHSSKRVCMLVALPY